MQPGLLAFFGDPKYPKPELELTAHVGWLVLVCLALLLTWALTRAESFRRGVLGREDPRVFAILRIGFALMTIQCFWNLEPYWRMLWSDEGIFLLEDARTRLGRTELRGWTSTDGFLGWWGLGRFVWGKQSLFFLHADPDFVRLYLWTFMGLLGLYAAGFRTRITGLICWFLMLGIYNRNALYLEGTDTVYRVFWFLMIFAPTGRAWSLDNWFRVWRERRRQQLGQRGFDVLRLLDRGVTLVWIALWGVAFLHVTQMPVWPLWLGLSGLFVVFVIQGFIESAADRGRPEDEPAPVVVYPLVPSWVRILMMAQLAAVYMTTGLVKTGHVWARGDALYFALNMDHFYRFENVTQVVSAPISLNLFRIATWITHYWEMCFPVVLVGMILRFGLQHRDQPWYREQQARRWRVWLGRLSLLGAYLVLYRINVLAYPWCKALVDGEPADPSLGLLRIHIVYAVAIPLAVVAWYAVGRWPLRLLKKGYQRGRLRIPPIVVDQHFLRAWFTGRRLWLTLGLSFHGFLILFMNIGMFPFIMLMTYAAYTESGPWLRVGRGIVERMRARPRLARLVPGNADELLGPGQDPSGARNDAPWWTRPYLLLAGAKTLLLMIARRRSTADLARVAREAGERDGRIPDLVVLVLALAGVGLIALRAHGYELNEELGKQWIKPAIRYWAYGAMAAALAFAWRRRNARDRAEMVGEGPPLAAGTLARTASLVFSLWHVAAVATTLFPSYPIFSSWRTVARRPTAEYVRVFSLTQSWKMFSPNPPRSNTFMQTVVVEQNGDRWDLRNNAFTDRPFPWIVNDRMRKMQRRMVGKGKWYLRYWASYQCREWTLATGRMPLEIEVNRLVTKIPKPEHVFRKGPYRPSDLKVYEKHVQTHQCERKGELPIYMKERHGLALSEEDLADKAKEAERADKRAQARRRSWERRKDFGGPEPSAEEPSAEEPPQ